MLSVFRPDRHTRSTVIKAWPSVPDLERGPGRIADSSTYEPEGDHGSAPTTRKSAGIRAQYVRVRGVVTPASLVVVAAGEPCHLRRQTRTSFRYRTVTRSRIQPIDRSILRRRTTRKSAGIRAQYVRVRGVVTPASLVVVAAGEQIRDSPSALSSATTDEDELPLPNGYPFKDPAYRPVHPPAKAGWDPCRTETGGCGSSCPYSDMEGSLAKEDEPVRLPPCHLRRQTRTSFRYRTVTRSRIQPIDRSILRDPGPICASPGGSDAGIIGGGGSGRADPRLVVWSVAASPRSQARPSSKRGRLSLTSNEDPDALPIPPPLLSQCCPSSDPTATRADSRQWGQV
jgi:hypothetical protein